MYVCIGMKNTFDCNTSRKALSRGYLHAVPGRYVLVTDPLAVEEHAAQAQLYGHVDDVLSSQVVVVVGLLLAVAYEPARTWFYDTNKYDMTTQIYGIRPINLPFEISLVAVRI